MELSDHLVRHEAARMISALTRIFGVHNLALAEDVVQDGFCRALEVWKFRGVPDSHPSAWLMATTKNRALDVLRRERSARVFSRQTWEGHCTANGPSLPPWKSNSPRVL
jgi:predicted RNA polymerase sigma factor